MRKAIVPVVSTLALAVSMAASAASFSYHGSLQDNGKPADGKYDLQLTLYSAADGGKVVGGPLTLYAVPVQHGSFDTQADFGPLTNVQNAWLAVNVKTAGSSGFSALSARAPVSADATAATGSVCPGAWTLAGNAGNPAGSYLGTADAQPLLFMVDGQQAGILSAPGATNQPNIVFGSSNNSIASGVINAVISGGSSNTVSGAGGDVAGGNSNQAVGINSFVAGWNNTAGGFASSVGGGETNAANGDHSTVSGGYQNKANGTYSAVAGGVNGQALGNYGFVAGGQNNIAAVDAFAAGAYAYAAQTGTFVWSDASSTKQFVSGINSPGAGNEFLVRATGGVYIASSINTDGSNLSGVKLAPGSGSWATLSDRNVKTAIAGIDPSRILDGVLEMPVSSWQYIAQKADIRHMGPMAQDFYAAFHLGEDNRHITEVDEGGVALAAIQGLNKKVESENASLKTQNAALKTEIDAIRKRLDKIEGGK